MLLWRLSSTFIWTKPSRQRKLAAMTTRALLSVLRLGVPSLVVSLALLSSCHSEPPPAAPAPSADAPPPGTFTETMATDAGLIDALAMHFPTPPPPATTSAPASSASASAAPEPGQGPITVTRNPTRIERALGTLRPRLRACYSAALAKDPKMSGNAIFKVVIAADGKVTSAEPNDASALPKPLIDCVRHAIVTLDVGADPGMTAPTTLTIPINVDAQ
jgi:hypothetical protein